MTVISPDITQLLFAFLFLPLIVLLLKTFDGRVSVSREIPAPVKPKTRREIWRDELREWEAEYAAAQKATLTPEQRQQSATDRFLTNTGLYALYAPIFKDARLINTAKAYDAQVEYLDGLCRKVQHANQTSSPPRL